MVSIILDNVAAGVPRTEILASYPSIKPDDIDAALAHAAVHLRPRKIHADLKAKQQTRANLAELRPLDPQPNPSAAE